MEEDPTFQAIWAELGGNKLSNKTVEKKNVNVVVSEQSQ